MQMHLGILALSTPGLLSFAIAPGTESRISSATSALPWAQSIDADNRPHTERRELRGIAPDSFSDAGNLWIGLYNSLQALIPSGVSAQYLSQFYEDTLSTALISRSFNEATTKSLMIRWGHIDLRFESNQPLSWNFLIGFLTLFVS